MKRGIGVAGALDHDIVRAIAAEAELLGYQTFWANDTPHGDGLASLAAAAEVTTSLRLGVGVIPVDRTPAEVIIERINRLNVPAGRLVIGIGAGRTKKGSLALVRRNAEFLREAGFRVVVGALGPRMVELGGSAADGALLSWLTPMMAARSVDIMRAAAGGRPVEAITYVRTALANGATRKLEAEALQYESFAQYAAHLERMGVRAIDTCVTGPTAAALQAGLSVLGECVDETVARAVVAEERTEDYLALVRAAAPEV